MALMIEGNVDQVRWEVPWKHLMRIVVAVGHF